MSQVQRYITKVCSQVKLFVLLNDIYRTRHTLSLVSQFICDAKHIMMLLIKTITFDLKVSTYIITSITVNQVG
jgi:hypothetical protein